jgi:hypothetical protein
LHWQSVSQISPFSSSTWPLGPQVGSPSFLQRKTPLSSASHTFEQQSQPSPQISPYTLCGPWLVSTGPDGRQPPIGKQRKKPCKSVVQRPEQHSMSSPVHGSNAGRHHVVFAQ